MSNYDVASPIRFPLKIYGEYVKYDTFKQPNGSTAEPSWSDF